MFKHILLATDGSDIAQKAGDTAIALAQVHGAQLTATFVIDPYPYTALGEDCSQAYHAYMNAAQAASEKATEKLYTQAKAAHVALDKRVVEGDDVATAIIAAAQEVKADIIVIGSHGRSGIERLLLGNVANKVLYMSTKPVLVVR